MLPVCPLSTLKTSPEVAIIGSSQVSMLYWKWNIHFIPCPVSLSTSKFLRQNSSLFVRSHISFYDGRLSKILRNLLTFRAGKSSQALLAGPKDSNIWSGLRPTAAPAPPLCKGSQKETFPTNYKRLAVAVIFQSSHRVLSHREFNSFSPPFLSYQESGSLLVSAHIARQDASFQLPDWSFTSKASREWEAQQRPHSCNLFALQPGCCTQFSLSEVLAAPSKTSSHNWAYKMAPEEKTRICCTLGKSPSSPGWCRF